MDENSTETIKFDSLNNYSLITHKLIMCLTGKSAPFFLNDTEYFGEVMEQVIMADWLWNGVGTKYGYRKTRAKWAICRIYDRWNKNKEKNFEFLDNAVAANISVDDPTVEVDNLDMSDYVTKQLDKIMLSDAEKFCIEEYFINSKSADSIAKDTSCTKQTVFNRINSGCKKIGKQLKLDMVGHNKCLNG